MREVSPARMLKALQRLSELHDDMTILQAKIFLLIAEYEGISAVDIIKRIRSNDSTVSRIVAILGFHGGRKTPPLGLIFEDICKEDRRRRRYYLTPKGRKMIKEMQKDMG